MDERVEERGGRVDGCLTDDRRTEGGRKAERKGRKEGIVSETSHITNK